MDKTKEYIKILLDKLGEDGIATGLVDDGRIFAISRDKLAELLKQVDEKGQKAAIIFIKDPGKIN